MIVLIVQIHLSVRAYDNDLAPHLTNTDVYIICCLEPESTTVVSMLGFGVAPVGKRKGHQTAAQSPNTYLIVMLCFLQRL